MCGILRIDHSGDVENRYCQTFRVKFVFQNFQNDYSQHILCETTNTEANKDEVESRLVSNSIGYISGAGHGTYEMFFGIDGKAIWRAGQNFDLTKGKIVHLLSCQTGALLGREMVEHGALAFWGYNVNFLFPRNTTVAPENDKLAEAIIKMDTIIDRGILAGRTGQDIYRSVTKYVATLTGALPAVYRGLLFSNYVHLVCPLISWGDEAVAIA